MDTKIQLKLRAATGADSQNVLEWRNDPVTVENSFNSNIISQEEHESWFTESLQNTQRKLLIAEKEKISIGIIRFDVNTYQT